MAKKAMVKRKGMLGDVAGSLKPKSKVKLANPAKVNKANLPSAKVKGKRQLVGDRAAKVSKNEMPDTGGYKRQLVEDRAASVPYGEQIDVIDQARRNVEQANVPPIRSVYSLETGYGVAMEGETGTQAIERIKQEQARKKKKVKAK